MQDILLKLDNFDYNKKLKLIETKYNISITNYTTKENMGVNNFILNFNHRLNHYKNIFHNKLNLKEDIKISTLQDLDTKEYIKLIVLINSIKKTKNGTMLEIQDQSGIIKCFINSKDKHLVKKINNIFVNEGIYIEGEAEKDIIWLKDIKTIDGNTINKNNEIQISKQADDIFCIFLSNLALPLKLDKNSHIQKLLKLLSGTTKNPKLLEISKKIKYIFINGELTAENNKEQLEIQYQEISKIINKIPTNICIIISDINPSITSPFVPQNIINYNINYSLQNLPNVILTTNPCNILINSKNSKLNILQYYNKNLKYYNDEIKKRNLQISKEELLLNKQHLNLCSISTPYIPDSIDDKLTIKKIPNIFFSGPNNKTTVYEANNNKTMIIKPENWNNNINNKNQCVLLNLKTFKSIILNL